MAKNKVIDFDLVMSSVSELKRLNSLDFVVILGGEPGLFPDALIRMVEAISALDINTRVETNASWARSREDALEFIKPYKQYNTTFMFSVDSFHEPFVNPQNVVHAVLASHELGLSWNIEVPYIGFNERVCTSDKRTDELLDEFLNELELQAGITLDNEPFYNADCICAKRFKESNGHIYQGKVFFKGRAVNEVAHLVSSGRGVPEDICDTVPWWNNGSQSTLELLSLDPDGNITKECGISLGNADNGIEQFVKSFDADKHPILSTLIKSGPLGLAHEAEEFGYVLKADYADKCHLCQEARNVLIAKYPEHLVPSQHFV